MKKPKLGLTGACGRMGQEIRTLVQKTGELSLSVALLRAGQKCEDFKYSIQKWEQAPAKEMDVIIDFSSPEVFRRTLVYAQKNKIALVSGTTGLSEKDFSDLKLASRKIPIIWSPNMSLGIAVFKKLVQSLGALKDFDAEIVEAHHIHKKDRPSGTAIALQQELQKTFHRKISTPLSLRMGGVVGDHELILASDEEIVRISHQALKRSVFAKGALCAAQKILKQGNGLFQMEDLI